MQLKSPVVMSALVMAESEALKIYHYYLFSPALIASFFQVGFIYRQASSHVDKLCCKVLGSRGPHTCVPRVNGATLPQQL